MVDVISGVPYSYYNVLHPQLNPPTAATATTTPTFPTVDTSNIANLLNGDKKASMGSLLDVAGVQFSPSVVSILQSVNGTFDDGADPIASLLSSTGLSNGTYVESLLGKSNGLPTSSYASLLSTAYSATKLNDATKATDVDPLQAVLAAYQNAFNAPVDTSA